MQYPYYWVVENAVYVKESAESAWQFYSYWAGFWPYTDAAKAGAKLHARHNEED